MRAFQLLDQMESSIKPHSAQANVRLRPLTPDHWPEVKRLNDADVALLSPMDSQQFTRMRKAADIAASINVDGEFAGFVITFTDRAEYDSANFKWFTARSTQPFVYLDRIIIDPVFRGRGVAGVAYDALEARADAMGRLICLEVNVDPPNGPSLSFHKRRGYREVGRRGSPGHVVSLMTNRASAIKGRSPEDRGRSVR